MTAITASLFLSLGRSSVSTCEQLYSSLSSKYTCSVRFGLGFGWAPHWQSDFSSSQTWFSFALKAGFMVCFSNVYPPGRTSEALLELIQGKFGYTVWSDIQEVWCLQMSLTVIGVTVLRGTLLYTSLVPICSSSFADFCSKFCGLH